VSSVLTGNLRATAIIKLAAFALDALLDLGVGVFGKTRRTDRPSSPITQKRAGDKHQSRFGPDTTVLIGDSLEDVRAAKLSRGKVVAVAMGTVPAVDLAAAGACVTLPDLASSPLLVRTIGHVPGG
jgi:phosphoglycolate phosphatase